MGLAIIFERSDARLPAWVAAWRDAWQEVALEPLDPRPDALAYDLPAVMARRVGDVAILRGGLALSLIDRADSLAAGLVGAVLVDPFEARTAPRDAARVARPPRTAALPIPAVVVPGRDVADRDHGRLAVHARMWEAAFDTDAGDPAGGPSRLVLDFLSVMLARSRQGIGRPGSHGPADRAVRSLC